MTFKTSKRPTMLVILDGFGYSSQSGGNAVAAAKMPFWSWLTKNYPHTLLHASGRHVGLIDGYIGNSEVGHLTIGAGRIVESVLKMFHDEIDSGKLFENQILIENFVKIKQEGGALHLMGLLSDGGVHSHERHLHALLAFAAQQRLKHVFIHAFLDGRDVAPKSAAQYLERLQHKIDELGIGEIASICGRFYAMDRDKNWDRTNACYNMLVGANKSIKIFKWQDVLSSEYFQGITDEFVVPTMLVPDAFIKPGDGVVFFNFRPDRAWQLAECFLTPANDSLTFFITATRYKQDFATLKNDILFDQPPVNNTLLDVFSGQKQSPTVFIIAETEKYAHVTYFFRGMVDKLLPNETRVLIPSIKVKNYIDYPEMSALEITKSLLNSFQTAPADFYLVNYANPDMVGHSGDMQATTEACECIDKQLETLYRQVVEVMGGTMFITSDHGNAEKKIDSVTGQPNTAHTINPVPFVFVNQMAKTIQKNVDWPKVPELGISSIAPTILEFMKLDKPAEMTSKLIKQIFADSKNT